MNNYNKHYIRPDADNNIIHGFSDAFEQPQTGDICIKEHGGRQFELAGQINPSLRTMDGIYLYRNVDGAVVVKTPGEIQVELTARPTPTPKPTELEKLAVETTMALAAVQEQTNMAIAEMTMLISAAMGGVSNV